MAVTLTKNLKLKVDSNLTANSKYNLERLDLLGSTFLTDSTNILNIRSQTDINIEPNSADIGGSGIGGTINLGTPNHKLASLSINAELLEFGAPLSLKDQAVGGTATLSLTYKSDINGPVDTTNRALRIDLDGSDRNLVMGGSFVLGGGDLTLSLSGATSLTLPQSGTLSTLAGAEVLTNKAISGSANTITDLTNTSISATAAIAGTKISPDFGNQTIRTLDKLEFEKSGNKTALKAASSGQSEDITFELPNSYGTVGQVLKTDGDGILYWSPASGGGTVTSVDLSAPGEFSVSGNPVTSAGTLTLTKVNQAANQVWAGPVSGPAAQPSFRSLTLADLPSNITLQAADLWSTTDGTSKVVTHGLGTSNVQVSLINLSDSSVILVDNIIITDNNTITLSSSETPSPFGWKVIVQGR